MTQQGLPWWCIERSKKVSRHHNGKLTENTPLVGMLSTAYGMFPKIKKSSICMFRVPFAKKHKRALFEKSIMALNAGLSKPQSQKELPPAMERLGKIKKEYPDVAHHYDTDVIPSKKADRVEKITWVTNEAYGEARKASECYTIVITQTQWSLEDIVLHHDQLERLNESFDHRNPNWAVGPIYHRKVSRIKAHLFISVVWFYVVPLIRTKMKDLNIDYSWERLREELS